jgi:hypothetical protein
MKKLFTLLLFIPFLGCNKETIQKNLVISAMTNGQWKVTKFMQGTTNATNDFSDYKFQFKENNSVDAIRVSNSAIEKSGAWSADPGARTITSQFTNAAPTLMLLNGTWRITNNSWTFVEATQNVSGVDHSLRLDKL